MDLPEYQSKELIAQYGVKIPVGRLAHSAQEAEAAARDMKSERYMVKAQIKAGGRGLAGGIKRAATPSAVRDAAAQMIGTRLVTEQTAAAGETIEEVYVEAAIDIAKDYYVAVALDPYSGQPVVIASASGGETFEQSAKNDPDIVQQIAIGSESEEELVAFFEELGFPDAYDAVSLVQGLLRAFEQNDMTLAEINPLAYTNSGDWIAVDAKVSLDGNAMFRRPELEELASDTHLSTAEKIAQENDINLVQLDGNIGVVVNGAGLGLAVNDMIIDAGGKPANFMDIRTTASSFDIAKGVGLILEDPNVKCLLLNVHGGGMTVCDTVAEGVAFAYARAERKPQILARLAGQNADWGMRILKDRHLPVEEFETTTQAINRAVQIGGGQG